MRQALHILAKDVRQFRYQIALVLAATAIVAYSSAQPWWALSNVDPAVFGAGRPLIQSDDGGLGGFQTYSSTPGAPLAGLLVIAWWFLIGLVVHAESIVGDRQFWLTRPYNRQSLWMAKAIFVVAFIHLPLFVAQTFILWVDGLPLAPNLSGLVWAQVIAAAVLTLPAMAIAALTRTMTQFVVWMLFVAFAQTAGFTLLYLFVVERFSPRYPMEHQLGSFGWVPVTSGAATIATVALVIHFLQFARRRTLAARVLAVAGWMCSVVMFGFLPWEIIFAAQSPLTKMPEQLHAELVAPRMVGKSAFGSSDTLDLPLHVTGVPAGSLIACEAAAVTVDNESGSVWRSGAIEYGSRIALAPDGCAIRVEVDHGFFAANRDRRVRIQSRLYLTVFGNEQSATIVPRTPPVEIPGVGMCRASAPQPRSAALECRTAFRSPARLVWARDDTGRGNLVTPSMSYSPFPSDLVINPVESYWTGAALNQSGAVTVVSQEPTAHVHLEADLRGVRLGDLEWGVR